MNRSSWTDTAVLGSGLVIFAGLSLWNIGSWSIWFDEAFSAYITKFSIADMARYTAHDVHPPLYYILLKGWEGLFGNSEVAMRSLSVLFALIAIAFGFLIIRRLFGRRAAYLTLPLLVVAPMTIRYAQEARMYTMAMAICASATYIFIRLELGSVVRGMKRKWLWLLYALLVAAGLWTHYFTSLIWIVHIVWAYSLAPGDTILKRFKSWLSAGWLKAYIIAFLLFIPWLPLFAIQAVGVQGGFWIGPITVDGVGNVFTSALLYQDVWRLQKWWAMLFIVTSIVLVTVCVRTYGQLPKHKRPGYTLIALYGVLPIALLTILSLPPLHPVLVERYFTHTLLGFYMLAGIALVLHKWQRHQLFWRITTYGLVLFTLLVGVSNVYTMGNFNNTNLSQPAARQTMQLISANGSYGEPVIAQSAYVFYESIYYQTKSHMVYIPYKNVAQGNAAMMIREREPHKIYNLEAFSSQHHKVWVIDISTDDNKQPPVATWRKLQTVWANDKYHAVEYATE